MDNVNGCVCVCAVKDIQMASEELKSSQPGQVYVYVCVCVLVSGTPSMASEELKSSQTGQLYDVKGSNNYENLSRVSVFLRCKSLT
jgi:hypothetical protein